MKATKSEVLRIWVVTMVLQDLGKYLVVYFGVTGVLRNKAFLHMLKLIGNWPQGVL